MSTIITTIPDACEFLISTCIDKTRIKWISRYADSINKTSESLSSARSELFSETESAILKIGNFSYDHQLASLFRHLNVEVQYFLFERFCFLRYVAIKSPETFNIRFDLDAPLYPQLSYMLTATWEYAISLCGKNLNYFISQCYKEMF